MGYLLGMARPLRVDVADGWYHVTSRGIDRRLIFMGPEEYRHFLDLLEKWVERFGLILYAYVLMPNHYHLLIQTPRANLSAAMQWLQTSYGMWFNRRHRRVGPLFQGRFKAFLLEPRTAGWPVSRYLHLNPVRTAALGLGKKERRAEERGQEAPGVDLVRERRRVLRTFPWSSYAVYGAWRPCPSWLTVEALLSLGGKGSRKKLQRQYRAYTEEGLGVKAIERPGDALEAGVLLGSQDFVERMKKRLTGNQREQPHLKGKDVPPGFEDIIAAVERVRGEQWVDFRDRHGDWGRDLVLYMCRRYGSMTLRRVGERAGGLDYAGVATAVRRFAARLERDRNLQSIAKETLEMANIKT